MARLSLHTIAQLWIDAGGPKDWAYTMAGITIFESGSDPSSVEQGVPYSLKGWGLWQITPGDSEPQCGTDAELLNPRRNACAAVAKFRSQGIGAWQGDPVGDAALNNGSRPLPKSYVNRLVSSQGYSLTGGSSSGAGLGGSALGSGCAAKGCAWKAPNVDLKLFSLGGQCIVSHCQLKALGGGVLVATGMLTMVLGGALVVVAGLEGKGPAAPAVQAGQSVLRQYRKLPVAKRAANARGGAPAPASRSEERRYRATEPKATTEEARKEYRRQRRNDAATLRRHGYDKPTQEEREAAGRRSGGPAF